MLRKIFFSLLLASLFSSSAYAENSNSPIGKWQTLNEKTKHPGSIVKISMEQNTLVGEIAELLPGSHYKATDVCTQCPDDLKNKPIVGLRFLWGFVPDATQKDTWTGGKVLDPNNGKIYQGSIKLTDHGNTMLLRGYWGPFWRTQTWTRS
jgi:uncharacterized protein (DUF2147 family)